MVCSVAHGAGVLAISPVEHAGCVVAVLQAELDIASAPALREELLGLLRPGASKLIIDLSAVTYADTSGIAVLVGAGRRAAPLGGWLRLASPTYEVTRIFSVTGMDRHFAIFGTVDEAVTGRQPVSAPDPRTGGQEAAARLLPAQAVAAHTWNSAVGGDVRPTLTSLFTHSGSWRDALRQVAPALEVPD